MKKALLFMMVLFLPGVNFTNAQLSKFVKNVKNNVQKEVLGDKNQDTGKKTMPEPASACADAQLILDLNGTLKVDYSEIGITSGDDGRILVEDYANSKYYIVKDGVTQGPYSKGDPEIAVFGVVSEEKETNLLLQYKNYISKSGDKFLITFMGKKYGPYAKIDQFFVTRSREKFAAMVTETVLISEDLSKKMEAAMKNAKTDEEKMNLSIQYAQQLQSGFGNADPMSIYSKLITNIEGVVYDPMKPLGGQFSGNYKYDDILIYNYDKITDLKGNTIFSKSQGDLDLENFFINSDNSRYASYSYGTLTFNDKSTLPDVFNPHWLKADGKIYLAYMYYSPKRNSIMQCKIPF